MLKLRFSTILYLFFTIRLSINFWAGTNYSSLFPDVTQKAWTIYSILRLAEMLLLAVFLLVDKKKISVKYFTMLSIYLVIVLSTYLSAGYWNLFDSLFLALAFGEIINIKKIVNIYLKVYIIGVIVTFMGYFSNLFIQREFLRENRLTFGFNSPNMLGLVLFVICILLTIKYEGKCSKLLIGLMYAISIFVYIGPNSRTASICIALLAIFNTLYKIKISRNKKFISLKSKLIIFLSSVFLFIITAVKTSVFDVFLNGSLETFYSRIKLSRIGLENYGLSLFGKKVAFLGELDVLAGKGAYFTLDCAYIYLPILCGVTSLIFFIYIYIKIINNCVSTKNIVLSNIFIVIIIYGLFENSVYGISFAFFYAYALCNNKNAYIQESKSMN